MSDEPLHPLEQAIRALLSDDSTAEVDALLAVLEVHSPDMSSPESPTCAECEDASGRDGNYADNYPWPCLTIKKVADALGVKA